jgi:ABC-2 type transport system ATP-binding protein
VVSSAELTAAKQQFLISSTVRRSDGVHVRVLGAEAPRGGVAVAPNLEDAYLYSLTQHRDAAALELAGVTR